jgi:hypothetical protein
LVNVKQKITVADIDALREHARRFIQAAHA